MAVIKIPSSNIYSKEDVTSLLKSKFCHIAAQPNKLLPKSEAIIEYTIKLFDVVDLDDGGKKFNYIGDDESINAIPFRLLDGGYAENIDSDGNIVPLIFPLDKICNIKMNSTFRPKAVTNLIYEETRTQYYVDSSTVTEGYHDYSFAYLGDSAKTYLVYDETTNELKYTEWYMEPGSDPEEKMQIFTGLVEIPTYYTTQVTIKVYGTFLEENASEYTYSGFEPTNDVSFTLPTNELMQSDLLYRDTGSIFKPYLDVLSKEVVNQYENGVDVVKIKCSLSEYYDTRGELAISLTDANLPMVFKKYDIVEPYIYTNEGEKPLLTSTSGTAKQFQVIGVDFDYSGVAWQTLTLRTI